ncbi:putative murein transglycosylase [Rosellinia necatrix]|uniref:lytic cellulose monooxygenase (C4-dehydrogenating) n=1 Tax=Rosellinia necatrix TaxID=77044 RepID=A0A1W2TWX4_ROSNE|nr:putative murein transglycosylase [Rosellinia necatrix]
MKSTSLLGLAAIMLGSAAQGHTLFTTLYINDVKQGQGDGTCVRQTTDLARPNSPVVDVTSDDMACGVGGTTPVPYTCAAPAGAKLTFEYRESPHAAGQGFIDESHKGPVAVYAKRLGSADADAAGPGWFKIWGEGYDAAADKWATEKVAEANGLLSIRIPAALPAGNYLFRPEVVAMHNVTPEVEPQFYIGCAQVFLETAVTAAALEVPAAKSVSIPGYLSRGDPAMTYNLYSDEEYADPKKPFPLMGPEPFVPAPPKKVVAAANSKIARQTQGAVPDECILLNANWCGVEVAAYDDLTGCWAAVEDCWAQNDACWDHQTPAGGRNCEVWAGKCKDLDARCSAEDFAGPPAYALKSDDFPPPGPIPDPVNADDVPLDTAVPVPSSSSSSDVPSTTRVVVTSSVPVTVTVIPVQSPSSSSSSAAASSSEAPDTTTRVVVTSSVPVTVTVTPTATASSSASLEPIPDFTPRPTATSKPHCGGRRRRQARRRL